MDSSNIERAVLGGVLMNGALAEELINAIGTDGYDAFEIPSCRVIYSSIVRLWKSGQEITPFSVIEDLRRSGQIEEAGGEEYILSLHKYLPSVAHVEAYIRRLRDRMLLRKLQRKMRELLDEIDWGVSNIWEFLSRVEREITDITQKGVESGFFSMDRIDEIAKKILEERDIVTTGYGSLDELTGGFAKGDLVIVAGRPGMGKTSLALSIAYNMAQRGIPVAIFSLEMSVEMLVMRLISMITKDVFGMGVPVNVIRQRAYNDVQRNLIVKALAHLKDLPIYINDRETGLLRIKALSRKMKIEKNVGAIFIDYLQQISVEWKVESRYEEISFISRTLKNLAKELEIPVVALSQLSREPEKRVDKRPQLSDLRESGSLEQDADLVLMVYRPGYYSRCSCPEDQKCEHKLISEIIVAKNRNGPTGTALMNFDGEFCLFEDRRYITVNRAIGVEE